MATPSAKTPATTNLTPTSTRKMASPHPLTASKGLSYKSPASAMKTPASAHSHHISTSSQPSSTPLLAHALTEGGVNLDSPAAALMGFTNSHGLTPLPIGQDGLGFAAGLRKMPANQSTTGEVRSAEAERIRRLQEIALALKSRVAGRGVTREGVVRVAQLSGFTTYWDESILTVAGQCVDLEILFDKEQRDVVKDVVLKISAAGSEEHQEESSEILKKNLAQMLGAETREPWNSLDSFAANIGRLSRLDTLSKGVNCFEAVGGLYTAFNKVWEEEKKRLSWRSELHHLCRGAVGRPMMNKQGKLGLAVDYWAEKQDLASSSSQQQGLTKEQSSEDAKGAASVIWTARISCEKGSPSVKVPHAWLAPDLLGTVAGGEAEEPDQQTDPKPLWKEADEPNGAGTPSKDDADALQAAGAGLVSSQSAEARFTFTLDPPLYLPLDTVAAFGSRGLIINADQAKVTTYQQALDRAKPSSSGQPQTLFDAKSPFLGSGSMKTYDGAGQEKECRQSYAVRSSPPLWCYPVETVAFAHPRQLAELLPTLRQYVRLWALLLKTAVGPMPVDQVSKVLGNGYKSGEKIVSRRPQKRSNRDSQVAKLDGILDSNRKRPPFPDESMPVDISLTLTEFQQHFRPKLEVIIPIGTLSSGLAKKQSFAYVSFAIELNGEILVLSIQGLPSSDPEKEKQKIARILALSEDLGVLAEWMLEKAKGSGR